MNTIKLQTKQDPDGAIDAIREAATRLLEAGEPLWPLDELTFENLAKRYPDCQLVSFYAIDELVGGAILYKKRPDYWPKEITEKSAIYISKLSVRTPFIGRRFSSVMLAEIENHYRTLVECVRLDCDSERPKLNAVYTKVGYQLIGHCVVANNYPTNFYEKVI